jgi:hypothetical protein
MSATLPPKSSADVQSSEYKVQKGYSLPNPLLECKVHTHKWPKADEFVDKPILLIEF